MADRFRNQHNLVDQDKLATTKFVVIGAGAIGSFFVQILAKMGAKDVTVFDDDSIDDHNVANQLYPSLFVGQSKVDALSRLALEMGDCRIKTIKARWHPDSSVDGDYIIVAVDNMDTRAAIWRHYKDRTWRSFIEGRMAAQVYRSYNVPFGNGDAYKFYETTLYPQSEAVPDRCGEKSIIFTVAQVASQMLASVKRSLMGEYTPTEVIYDCLNDEVTKTYHTEPNFEVIEAPDEPEPVGEEKANTNGTNQEAVSANAENHIPA